MKGMVDVVVGKMNLIKVEREIYHYMAKGPDRLVVDIKLENDGYRATVWIDTKTFKKKC